MVVVSVCGDRPVRAVDQAGVRCRSMQPGCARARDAADGREEARAGAAVVAAAVDLDPEGRRSRPSSPSGRRTGPCRCSARCRSLRCRRPRSSPCCGRSTAWCPGSSSRARRRCRSSRHARSGVVWTVNEFADSVPPMIERDRVVVRRAVHGTVSVNEVPADSSGRCDLSRDRGRSRPSVDGIPGRAGRRAP